MPVGSLWVREECRSKTNLFSKVGMGAKSVLFSLGSAPGLTLHHALRLGGRHCFLTEITRISPVLWEIGGALIEPSLWEARRLRLELDGNKRPVALPPEPVAFPACLTEKYLGYKQEKPMAVEEQTMVLVTPKPVLLSVNDLVTGGGRTYEVRVCHLLDEFKNEYEICRRKDV